MPAPTTKDVLIVDDDEAMRLLLAAELARLDATCDTAGDGSAAMGQASTTRYDVLLVDLETPRLDGRSLIHLVREREDHSNGRPIVLLMTSARHPQYFDDLGNDVQAVLHKPFDITEIAELVLGCVKGARARSLTPLRGERVAPSAG